MGHNTKQKELTIGKGFVGRDGVGRKELRKGRVRAIRMFYTHVWKCQGTIID